MLELLAMAAVVGIMIAGALYARRSREPKFLATNEYWVYLPRAMMPPQDAVMRRVLDDRYAQKGQKPVTPREGLLMSDIRLHIGLLLRSKNPNIFRPDLFEEHVEPTAAILERLANSESVVKIRYISEEPLKNRANVQLLPHLAGAVADLGDGQVIYDCMKEELTSAEDLTNLLSTQLDLTSADIQVRAVWRKLEHGGWAETRGMRKVGLPELATDPMEPDEQVLVTEVLEAAAKKLWDAEVFTEQLRVEAFDDTFHVILAPPRDRMSHVQILRVQSD